MNSANAWTLFTRLGEAELLLPTMAAALVWLCLNPATRGLARTWALAGFAVASLTTASKVAFIGYRIGWESIDFTGFSGHSMFAALILPVLARIAAGRAPAPWPRLAVALGYAWAGAIAYSRIVTDAHSPSEALAGFVLGAAASAIALSAQRTEVQAPPAWLLVGVVAWMLALPVGAPPSRTHGWVTAVALELSGRSAPYTRHQMHRDAAYERRHGGPRESSELDAARPT